MYEPYIEIFTFLVLAIRVDDASMQKAIQAIETLAKDYFIYLWPFEGKADIEELQTLALLLLHGFRNERTIREVWNQFKECRHHVHTKTGTWTALQYDGPLDDTHHAILKAVTATVLSLDPVEISLGRSPTSFMLLQACFIQDTLEAGLFADDDAPSVTYNLGSYFDLDRVRE